jgi:hypothetical protein
MIKRYIRPLHKLGNSKIIVLKKKNQGNKKLVK